MAICLFFAPLSRALVSLGTGLLGLSLIIQLTEKKIKLKSSWWIAVLPAALLILLSFLHSIFGSSQVDWTMVLLYLPLLLIPIAISGLRLDHPWIRIIFLITILIFAGFAASSSIRYLLNPDKINEALLQSKHVPLTTKMHHIYFGLYLGVLAWIGAYYARNTKLKSYRLAIWTGVVVLLVCLHVLSSRTGLLAFYFSIGVFSLQILLGSTSTRTKLIMITAALLVPTIAVMTIPSIKYKIQNTKEDLVVLSEGGEEVNFKSMSMRVESWKASWTSIKKNWVWGIGDADFKKELHKAYEANDSKLLPENRIAPHNQFLETWMRYGIFASLALLSLFVLPLLWKRDQRVSWFWPLWMLLFSSFMVESVLQRQMGIILFSIAYFLFYNMNVKQRSSS